MLSVFDYFDFRLFLRDIFIEKKRQCKTFSHRSLAQKLGLSTSNFILLIMQGKRNLGADLRGKITEYFCMNTNETQYFETLVNLGQAKSDAEKNRLLSRLVGMRKSLRITTLTDAQIEYLSSWYNPVIRELVTSTDWNGDYARLGRMVRPAITASQARKAVRLLIDCGLIIECNGSYKQPSSLVSLFPKTVSPVITAFHREMALRAAEALDTPDTENRNMTGCTLHISRKTFDLITEELSECRKRILKLAQADNDADSVYHCNFHFFAVSQPEKKKKGK